MEKVVFSNFLNCYNFPTLAPDPQHCPQLAKTNAVSFLQSSAHRIFCFCKTTAFLKKLCTPMGKYKCKGGNNIKSSPPLESPDGEL